MSDAHKGIPGKAGYPVTEQEHRDIEEATSPKDNGGPAFPLMPPCDAEGNQARGTPFPHDGMTLRDYFAIRCLPQWFGQSSPAERARMAYVDADAMLKARDA